MVIIKVNVCDRDEQPEFARAHCHRQPAHALPAIGFSRADAELSYELAYLCIG
jgi:hypothetical protein